MNYLFGGIKLDAKMYGVFDGFPLNSALFGNIVTHVNSVYLEDHLRTDVRVNNHGDRNSPKDRVAGPLPNGRTS